MRHVIRCRCCTAICRHGLFQQWERHAKVAESCFIRVAFTVMCHAVTQCAVGCRVHPGLHIGIAIILCLFQVLAAAENRTGTHPCNTAGSCRFCSVFVLHHAVRNTVCNVAALCYANQTAAVIIAGYHTGRIAGIDSGCRALPDQASNIAAAPHFAGRVTVLYSAAPGIANQTANIAAASCVDCPKAIRKGCLVCY